MSNSTDSENEESQQIHHVEPANSNTPVPEMNIGDFDGLFSGAVFKNCTFQFTFKK